MIPDSYLTFRSDNSNLYILQRRHPHYLALISYKPDDTALIEVQVTGYKIWIVFAGTLSGNTVLMTQDWKEQLSSTFIDMADYYLYQRIHKEPERYKKLIF